MIFKSKKIFVFLLSLSLTSCLLFNSDDNESLQAIDKDSKPTWLKDKNCGNSLCSIGISPKNDSGFSSQVKEAELSGRQDIITKIKMRVLVALKDQELNLNTNKKVNFEKIFDKFSNKFDLLSIKRNGIFVDDNGTVYINMQLEKKALESELDKFKRILCKDLQNYGISDSDSKKFLSTVDKLKEELTKR